MPLTLAQKSDVRRHLGYPVIGLPNNQQLGSGNAGYRFFAVWGQLEYRLNNLNADEEARLTGYAYGALALIGNNPNPGDTISVTFTGGGLAAPVTLTATAQPGDTPLIFLNRLAALGATNPQLQNAQYRAVTPFQSGIYSYAQTPLPEIAFTNPAGFTMSTSFTGATAPQVTANGALLPPSASLDGINTIWGYLPILNGLENALLGTSQNLDTAKADVWTARANELGQRRSMYIGWTRHLSNYLAIPINRGRFSSIAGPRASALA